MGAVSSSFLSEIKLEEVDILAKPQYPACSFRDATIPSKSSSGPSRCARKACTNRTRAATQLPQMKYGVEADIQPTDRAVEIRLTMALVAARQVDVWGSTASPVDNAGYA